MGTGRLRPTQVRFAERQFGFEFTAYEMQRQQEVYKALRNRYRALRLTCHIGKEGKELRCFISAAVNTYADTLRTVLKRKNIIPIASEELSVTGLSLRDKISNEISGSDILIAVADIARKQAIPCSSNWSWLLQEVRIYIMPQ
jgi:hypothetical protein